MVAISVTTGCAYGTASCAECRALARCWHRRSNAADGSSQDRAPRGVSIVTTGSISGVPFTMWTWLADSVFGLSLCSNPTQSVRQAAVEVQTDDIRSIYDFGGPRSLKPCKRNIHQVRADGHQTAAKGACLPHGPGDSLTPQAQLTPEGCRLSERKGSYHMPLQSESCAPEKSQ